MSRLAFTSPLDRREVADEIFHSPYIGDTLTSDGDPDSGGVSVLSRATVASAQAGEATSGFADTSMPLQFAYPNGGVTGCRDTFSVTLNDLEAHVVYALDIATAQEGPWASWIYFSLDNGPAEDIAANRRTILVNNDYNGVKWFRARRTTTSLSPSLGDQILASPAVPLPAVVAAPSVTIDNLTDISAIGGDSGAYLKLAGIYDMPLSVLEAPHLPVSDKAYYRVSKKYAGKESDQNTFGDLLGTPTFHHPVTATGPVGSVTKWTRDGSEPTVNTVIETLDGQAANAAAHRSDFAMAIKARSFVGGCQSPLSLVAVDRGKFERHRVTVHLSGQAVVASCDLPRLEQVYGYTTDANGTHWGPLAGQFQSVESGNSCQNLWGGPGGLDDHEKSLSQSGTGALGGGNPPVIHNVSLTTVERDDSYGWTNHIVSAQGFVVSTCDYDRPASYDSYPEVNNWFLASSELSQHIIVISASGGTGGGSLGGPFPFHLDPAVIGAQLGDTAENNLLPADPANTAGLHHLTGFDSIWSCLPFTTANPRDDYWASPIAGEPVVPSLPSPKDPGLFVDYDAFEAYEDTSSAETATLDQGDGWGANWNVVAWTSLTGLDDFESYPEGSYSDSLPLAAEGFGNVGWTILDGASGVIYVEDFESYAEQTLNPGVLDLESGSGFSGAWFFPGALDGVEDFEAFADGYTFPSNAETTVSSGDSSFAGKWFTSALPLATQTFFDGIGGGVAGLIAQWRANSITGHVDGDALASWPDVSGNAYGLLQTVVGNRPVYKTGQINSLPAVQFVAANSNYFNAPSVLTCLGAADMFMVVKIATQPPATSAKTGIYKLGGANAASPTTHFPFTDDNVYNSFMTDTRKSCGNKPGLTFWNLLEVWSAPSDWAQLFNGISHFSTASNSLDFTGNVYLGADVAGGVYLDGYIAEILLFDHKLTTSERSVVKTYIAAKYGLTIS